VNFNVISGPNSGTNGTSVTDNLGQATFSYAGGSAGIDQIRACFIPPQGELSICSNILNFQWIDCTCIPTLSQWGLIILGLLFLSAAVVFIQRKQYSFAIAGETETTSGTKILFNRRTYFITWAILLGIAAVIFITEIVLSISVPIQDIAGSLVSSAILAYILHHLIPSRKE
jgi:IPTL-CTERM motif